MELVHDVAALTHRHPRSLIACGIYACIGVPERYTMEWQDRYCVPNYSDYWGTGSMAYDDLTQRLSEENVSQYDDFECRVMLTTLLREEHWHNGSFEKRWKKGEPQRLCRRMLELWESDTDADKKKI